VVFNRGNWVVPNRGNPAIIDTGAFEVGQSGKRRPAVLHAGSDHDGLGADQLAVVESGAEAFVLEALEFTARRGIAKRVPNFIACIWPRQTRSPPEIPVGKPI